MRTGHETRHPTHRDTEPPALAELTKTLKPTTMPKPPALMQCTLVPAEHCGVWGIDRIAQTLRLPAECAQGCACHTHRAVRSSTGDLAHHVQDKSQRDGAHDKLGWNAHLEEEQRWH